MKWSPVLHVLTVLVGLLAVAALITGWVTSGKGLMGFLREDLDDQALILILVAIWLALGTLIHLVSEEQQA